MRITDTAHTPTGASGAVTLPGNREGDVPSAIDGSTPAARPTPGIRISTTATRTTTTRTTSSAPAPSADRTDAVLSFPDLVAAYFDCRRTKRNTASALAFEQDLEANLARLHDELTDGAYRPGRSICFVINRPKTREVWAAEFRDRIVHHLLYNRIGPRFERAFITDSCACIPGRGTLYAARRLEHKVRSITQSWNRPARYLKCDVTNFFVRIDKRILRGRLAARIPEPWWLALAETILLHDPRTDVELRGHAAALGRVPAHKSLFNQPAHRGLPIGNLSSQFFANVYLDALDQHAKHTLKIRHYVRYVDDVVLLHESAQQLNAWCAAIDAFLRTELALELNPAKTVRQPLTRGVDFVGHILKPWHQTIRRRTAHDALTRTAGVPAEDLWRTANSYFGLFRQATHSHADRAELARLVRQRGLAVDHRLTKAYR